MFRLAFFAAWSVAIAVQFAAPIPVRGEMDVRGAVVDARGIAAENASVALFRRQTRRDGVKVAETKTDVDGKFNFLWTQDDAATLWVEAVDAAGHECGAKLIAYTGEPIAGVTVRLSPPREIAVLVSNALGSPEKNARVFALAGLPRYPSAYTDSDGKAVLRVPSANPFYCLCAAQPGGGVDYIRFRAHSEVREDPNWKELKDETVALTLSPVWRVPVTLQDEEGRPIGGAEVRTMTVNLPNKGDFLSACWARCVTDERGQAQLDYPSRNLNPVRIEVRAAGYHAPQNWDYDPAKSPSIDLTLTKYVRLRGIVKDSQGVPAAEALVHISSGGGAFDREVVRTGPAGEFELPVPPVNAYLLVAKRDGEVSQAEICAFIHDRLMWSPVELRLEPATQVSGILKNTAGRPIPHESVFIGFDLRAEDARIRKALGPDGWADLGNMYFRLRTDAAGKFTLRAGRGDYLIDYGEHEDTRMFHLAGEKQKSIQVTANKTAATIKGRIIAKDPADLARVVMKIKSLDKIWETRREVVVSKGKFSVEVSGRSALVALTADQDLAAVYQVDPVDDEVVLILQPTVEVRGRLLNRESQEPSAGRTIRGGSRVQSVSAVTDREGRFTLRGMIPGEEYRILQGVSGGEQLLTEVTVQPDEPIELGDLVPSR